jgi:hypothetical protein
VRYELGHPTRHVMLSDYFLFSLLALSFAGMHASGRRFVCYAFHLCAGSREGVSLSRSSARATRESAALSLVLCLPVHPCTLSRLAAACFCAEAAPLWSCSKRDFLITLLYTGYLQIPSWVLLLMYLLNRLSANGSERTRDEDGIVYV